MTRTERRLYEASRWRKAWELSLVWLPPFTQKTAVVLLGVLVVTLALLGGLSVLPQRLQPGPKGQLQASSLPAQASVQAEGSATATGTTQPPLPEPPAPRGSGRAGASGTVLTGTAAEPSANFSTRARAETATPQASQSPATSAAPPPTTTAPPADDDEPAPAPPKRGLLSPVTDTLDGLLGG